MQKTQREDLSLEQSERRAHLMECVQQGDPAAYRVLLDDITMDLRSFLGRRVRDRQDLEDLVQDVLLALHRARHTYDPSRRFEAWMFAIARHVMIDGFRRRGVRARWEQPTDRGATFEAVSDGSVGEIALADVLSTLPTPQREALEMVTLDGMSLEDAASRAGIRQGALRVRIHRGYRALRARLLGKDG
mgnify:CR=1 FL=1